MPNSISIVTRRNIFDFIEVEGVKWSGRLQEVDFLARIFDLHEMESNDSRLTNAAEDIWQHRVLNPHDWEDNWIFRDDRFNLINCDDSTFLRFLCEMIHPVARSESSEVLMLANMFNENLKEDGFEIIEKTRVSGRPVFAGRLKVFGNESLVRRVQDINRVLNAEYVSKQITLMESSIESAPHVSIGLAKELVETCCKSILVERNEEFDRNWDLPKLMKETAKLLRLVPMDIPNEVRASDSIRKILGSLSSVVHGISEVRNEYGSGHGKDRGFKGLLPRHAKLVVGAASTLAVYLYETHESRITENGVNSKLF